MTGAAQNLANVPRSCRQIVATDELRVFRGTKGCVVIVVIVVKPVTDQKVHCVCACCAYDHIVAANVECRAGAGIAGWYDDAFRRRGASPIPARKELPAGVPDDCIGGVKRHGCAGAGNDLNHRIQAYGECVLCARTATAARRNDVVKEKFASASASPRCTSASRTSVCPIARAHPRHRLQRTVRWRRLSAGRGLSTLLESCSAGGRPQ